MLTVEEITGNMAQAIGTSKYIKHNLNRNLVFTDGVNQLRADANCHWLIDAIASYKRKELFQIWELKTDLEKKTAVLTMREDEDEIVRQEIPYTDFPLEEIKFFVQEGGYGSAENWTTCLVLMLTSEY